MNNEAEPLIQNANQDKKWDKKRNNVPCVCSKRWILAYVGMFGFLCMFAIRTNMSVTIVCMVNRTSVNWTTINNSRSDMYLSKKGEFNWNKKEQSVILGRYGGKRVIGGGMFLGSVACLLIPLAVRTHIILVDAIRVFQGLSAGVMFLAFHSLWGKWSPPLETSKLTTFCYSGTTIGTILTFSVSGVLCDYGFDGGWPSIFYITGGMALLFTVIWLFVVADSPAEHPSISEEERSFILNNTRNRMDEVRSIPWVPLLKSKAMWACTIANFCNDWVGYTFLISLPTFMKEAWNYDIEANGVLSALPSVASLLIGLSSAFLADCVRSSADITTTTTRRIIQVTAFAGTAGCLVGVGFIRPEFRNMGVVVLIIGLGILGLGTTGYNVNHIDFAPKYAGVTMGITNTFGAVAGFLAPLAAGLMTPDSLQEEWRNVFFFGSGLCIFGAIVFGTFAKGEIEPWAKDDKEIHIDVKKETNF